MTNPETVTPNTLRGAQIKDDNAIATGWLYNNITTETTTLVKTGAGFLHAIVINTPVATGTIELDDALTHTTPKIGTITTPTGVQPITLIFDIAFNTGLSITTGAEAQDITVVYV